MLFIEKIELDTYLINMQSGLFMALQEKVIACGVRLTIYSMVLRFVGGPLCTAVGSIALGLRSNTLRIAIVQVII